MESKVLEEYSNEELKAMVEDPTVSYKGFRDVLLRGFAERSLIPEATIKKYPLDAQLLQQTDKLKKFERKIEALRKGKLMEHWAKPEGHKTPAPS